MTQVLLQAAEAGHQVKELPMSPIWYGVITLSIAFVLLGILWSFRNTLALDPVAHDAEDSDGTSPAAGAEDRRSGSQH